MQHLTTMLGRVRARYEDMNYTHLHIQWFTVSVFSTTTYDITDQSANVDIRAVLCRLV